MADAIDNLFAETTGADTGALTPDLGIGDIPEWDSAAHMAFIAAAEDKWDLMLDGDEVVEMTNYGKLKTILTGHVDDL
ncbi:MAG: hypothetical protein WA979_08630 [Pacificimonas sp.]